MKCDVGCHAPGLRSRGGGGRSPREGPRRPYSLPVLRPTRGGSSTTFQVLPPLLLQFHRLQQQEPALRRQVVGQVGPVGRGRPDNRHVDRLQRLQTPLAGNLEPPDRFDLVAEELHAHRPIPVGRKDVEDPAADGELAGQLHGRRVEKTVFHQPSGKLCRRPSNRRRGACGYAAPGSRGWEPAARGSECWSRRASVRRRLRSNFNRCSRWPKTSSWAARSNDSAAGNRSGFSRVKSAKSSISSSTWSICGQTTASVAGALGGQRGRHQRARRTPDSVESRRMAPRQTFDDLGEARL